MAHQPVELRRARAAPGRADYDLCKCGQPKRAKSPTCAACHIHQPNSGRFARGGPRPGGLPRAAIGAERIDSKSGEIFVKISNDNPYHRYPHSGLWVARRVLKWVGAHGPVPDGLIVRRLSADRFDDRPENMVLVDRRVNMLLNNGHWVSPRQPWRTLPPDRETRLAAVAAAVASAMAREAAKGAT